jgi:large repetitive protein
VYSDTQNKGLSVGERRLARFQAGMAWRDTERNIWHSLTRFEHRVEDDSTLSTGAIDRVVDVFSFHTSYQPSRGNLINARYAAKRAVEDSLGLKSTSFAQLAAIRYTYDLTERFDLGAQASYLVNAGARSRQFGLGVEVGYLLDRNLWLSAGYNVFGFRDRDLAGSDVLDRGVLLRLRMKFDEDLFSKRESAAPAAQKTP